MSVVIPAHNAARTLTATLESLRAQQYENWEAIVVDDGSTDGTAALTRHYTRLDARIRLCMQKRGGEAAARNCGIAHARHAWLLFLDADDTIAPVHMQRLMAALAADGSLVGAYCDWVRVAPDGTPGDTEYAPEPDVLFAVAARHCPFAVHACIVQRRLVEEIGRFDAALRTCPDWDLWQRVARTGRRLTRVAEPLALYWMRSGSAGGRALHVLVDGWTVIDRGHRSDARVRRPDPRFANGADASQRDAVKSLFLCWVAGLLIGQGSRAEFLVFRLRALRHQRLDADSAVDVLILALLLPGCHTSSEWPLLWPVVRGRLRDFLTALGKATSAPDLCAEVEQRMEARIQAWQGGRSSGPVAPDRRGVRRQDALSTGGVILLYHRVAELASDPWQSSVTPQHFAEHLDVLGSWARVVPLGEIASGAPAGPGRRRLAAITFDDGYADNLYDAAPLLRRRCIPATVFAVASEESRPSDFWWDELSHLILECQLPANLAVSVGDDVIQLHQEPIATAVAANQLVPSKWRAWEPPVTSAQRFFVEVWTRLRVYDAGARDTVIDELYARCHKERKPEAQNRRLTHAELERLASEGLEIGAHTASHSALALVSSYARELEIHENRRILEEVIGAPVVSFSYRFGSGGDCTAETRHLVGGAGFLRACCGAPGLVTQDSDVYALPRFHVPDVDGAAFESWLLQKLAQVAAA